MIKETINVDFKNVYIIPIIDIEDNILWPNHVVKYTPEFDSIYSNNPLVKKLFSDAGYKVNSIEMVKREKYTGTNVRKSLKNDTGEWEKLVPEKVRELIYEFDGVERIKSIHSNDY